MSRHNGIGMTIIVVVVVIVLMVATIAFATLTSQSSTPASSTTSSTSSSGTLTASSEGSSTTYCVQSGIHGTLFVRVITDNTNQPIEGANVTATITDYCNPDYQTAMNFTNSSGYSTGLSWTGDFIVNVMYAGTHYTFPAQTSGAVSLATLSIPSGVVVERTIACYGLGCAYTNTTVTAS